MNSILLDTCALAVAVLSDVQFKDGDAVYTFYVREEGGLILLHAEYDETDIYARDGKVERQKTRDWVIKPGTQESQIVQTAFKCALTSMEHRCREHFHYKGALVFGPHYDVNDLVKLCQAGRENAGG